MTKPNGGRDKYAVLAAIWILASNDETSMITYQSIRGRLGLPAEFLLRELVAEHGELFRQGMPEARLDAWKSEMLNGKHRPSFIRNAESEIKKVELINALTPNDGFRSQFRAARAAPQSPVAIIEWGLDHIERLRKADSEQREANAKSWQMWLVFGTGVAGVIATIIAAIFKK